MAAGRYAPFPSETGDQEFYANNPNAVGFFLHEAVGQPDYISLKQSERDKSPPWAAELIIHQLVQFRFRAANAQMMEAVNRNDPTAYLDAYLLHEAQAEALPCRAASEMVNAGIALTRSGHQFAPLFVANNDLLTLGMGQKTVKSTWSGVWGPVRAAEWGAWRFVLRTEHREGGRR
jgi:hypothetical protein